MSPLFPTGTGRPLGAPDSGYERVDDAHAIRSLLRTLPARQRRCAELRFYQDLTQAEIAATVGISQTQAGRLLHGATELLQTTAGPSLSVLHEELEDGGDDHDRQGDRGDGREAGAAEPEAAAGGRRGSRVGHGHPVPRRPA